MVRAKKHLGQHFLIDENIAQNIVDGIDFAQPTQIVEVGPGTGVLTKHLIQSDVPFRALDVDLESVDYLKKKYPAHSKKFVLGDFLQESLDRERTVVIGNFPYNISSQLFFKIWEDKDRISQVVCMVQEEVAKRVSSDHGSKVYGILSVLLQAFYHIDYLFGVPPESFDPPPKVQSGVIRLTRNETKELGCDPQTLKSVVKMAFGKRRKTLRNALKDLALPAEITAHSTFDLRAEQLSVADFITLTANIEKWKAQ